MITTTAKTIGWAALVAAAHGTFILGWTLAVGIGGTLLMVAGFAVTDWITGVASWDHAYAGRLGSMAAALVSGFSIPVGAGLALQRFATKCSRIFSPSSLDDGPRVAVTLFCYALCLLLIALPLYLFGAAAFRVLVVILDGGPNDAIALGLPRYSRVIPVLVFGAVVFGLAEQARRRQ